MATYQLGSTLQWRFLVTSSAGAAADMGTAAATITLPDGTTAAGTVSNTPTGTYNVSYATTLLPGRYVATLTGTGANSGGAPYTDVADVFPVDPRLIISLDDARGALNEPATRTVDDEELRLYCVAATLVVEHIAGAVLRQSRTVTVSGLGRRAIPLPDYADSITTVVEDTVTLAATDYALDEFGMLWRGRRPGAGNWSDDTPRNVAITYVVASDGIIEANVIVAARDLVAHLYKSQRPRAMSPYGAAAGDEPVTMVAGYAVPNRVVDLLRPSMSNRVPGLA